MTRFLAGMLLAFALCLAGWDGIRRAAVVVMGASLSAAEAAQEQAERALEEVRR